MLQQKNDVFERHYTEFIELAAHDLQAPLRKLEILAEGLVNKYSFVEQEEAQQYLRRIRSSVTQLRNLVSGLQELSLAAPGLMQWTICDLNEILRNVILELQPVLRQSEATVHQSELPIIQGDKTQIDLLFKKIIENSIKFRKKESYPNIEIHSRILPEEKKNDLTLHSGEYVEVIFSDNGIGFDESEESRIFQPLFRLHGKTEYPGTGLGLACVKRIAENHNGFVFAETDKDQGTQIHLVLPKNN